MLRFLFLSFLSYFRELRCLFYLTWELWDEKSRRSVNRGILLTTQIGFKKLGDDKIVAQPKLFSRENGNKFETRFWDLPLSAPSFIGLFWFEAWCLFATSSAPSYFRASSELYFSSAHNLCSTVLLWTLKMKTSYTRLSVCAPNRLFTAGPFEFQNCFSGLMFY